MGLQQVIEAWPTLREQIRQAILNLIWRPVDASVDRLDRRATSSCAVSHQSGLRSISSTIFAILFAGGYL